MGNNPSRTDSQVPVVLLPTSQNNRPINKTEDIDTSEHTMDHTKRMQFSAGGRCSAGAKEEQQRDKRRKLNHTTSAATSTASGKRIAIIPPAALPDAHLPEAGEVCIRLTAADVRMWREAVEDERVERQEQEQEEQARLYSSSVALSSSAVMGSSRPGKRKCPQGADRGRGAAMYRSASDLSLANYSGGSVSAALPIPVPVATPETAPLPTPKFREMSTKWLARLSVNRYRQFQLEIARGEHRHHFERTGAGGQTIGRPQQQNRLPLPSAFRGLARAPSKVCMAAPPTLPAFKRRSERISDFHPSSGDSSGSGSGFYCGEGGDADEVIVEFDDDEEQEKEQKEKTPAQAAEAQSKPRSHSNTYGRNVVSPPVANSLQARDTRSGNNNSQQFHPLTSGNTRGFHAYPAAGVASAATTVRMLLPTASSQGKRAGSTPSPTSVAAPCLHVPANSKATKTSVDCGPSSPMTTRRGTVISAGLDDASVLPVRKTTSGKTRIPVKPHPEICTQRRSARVSGR